MCVTDGNVWARGNIPIGRCDGSAGGINDRLLHLALMKAYFQLIIIAPVCFFPARALFAVIRRDILVAVALVASRHPKLKTVKKTRRETTVQGKKRKSVVEN